MTPKYKVDDKLHIDSACGNFRYFCVVGAVEKYENTAVYRIAFFHPETGMPQTAWAEEKNLHYMT